jgi:osmotically-inducible protein OsmY
MTQPNFESGRFGPSRRGVDVVGSVIWSRHEADDGHGAYTIADAVANALYWDLALPRHRVVARCDDGWVTLSGKVERAYQRSSAEADVLRVDGVRGVTNAITVGAAASEIGAPAKRVGG